MWLFLLDLHFSFNDLIINEISTMLNRQIILIFFTSIAMVLFTARCTKVKRVIKSKPYELLELSKKESLKLNDKLACIDSAYYLSQKSSIDSLALAIIFEKAFIHLKKREADSFYYYNQLLVQRAKTLHAITYKAKGYFNLGFYFQYVTKIPDSAFHYYIQSKNNYLAIEDTIQAGNSLLNMAIIQKNRANFFVAKEILTESLQYLVKSEDTKYLASAYNELGTNNSKLLNFTDARTYYKKAIAVTNSKYNTISYKNNIALSYNEQGDYQPALNLLQNLILDSLLQKGSVLYARVLHNLTYAQWHLGKKHVLPRFLQALEIRKNKNDKRGQIQSYTNIGEYYTKTNPQKAKKYLDTVIQIAKDMKNPRAETDALQFLMTLQPENITFKDRYIFLKDSLYLQELKVKTQFAKMRYDDLQEKEQILQLQRETAEKKTALATQKAQKILFLSLSSFLLIAGVSLFYALRQRYKKEKLKEVYKTEKQISKRLHDELSNDIYGLMASIEQNPTANRLYLLDRLEKIYGQTRNISHDHREINTGAAFAAELKDTLGAFYNEETTVMVKGLESVSWEKVSDYKSVAIHRSLKEFMVNMKKHSEASLVAIDFKQDKKLLHIAYSDNGIGIDTTQKFGVGLNNTVSRIHGINGKIKFDSENNHGTKITIKIPN